MLLNSNSRGQSRSICCFRHRTFWQEFGQTKVQDLDLASLAGEKIGRVDVPMHDAFRVSRIQPIGNLDGYFEQLLNLQSLAQPLLECLPSSSSMAMNGVPSCSSMS